MGEKRRYDVVASDNDKDNDDNKDNGLENSEHVRDTKSLKMMPAVPSPIILPRRIIELPPRITINKMQDVLVQALADPKSLDLTIVCGFKNFKVHKLVVCAQSTKLSELCKKEKGKDTETIHVDHTYMWEIRYLITFLYTSTYPEPADQVTRIERNMAMYDVADRFGVPHLHRYAASRVEQSVQEFSGPYMLGGYMKIARKAFKNDAGSHLLLRPVLVKVAKDHLKKLMEDEAYCTDFRALLLEAPELMWTLLKPVDEVTDRKGG